MFSQIRNNKFHADLRGTQKSHTSCCSATLAIDKNSWKDSKTRATRTSRVAPDI